MDLKDAGLAVGYWRRYYTPEEIEEILANTTTTMFVSGRYPIHVRLMLQPTAAPTVVMAHGLIVYGAVFAQMQLPFFRAGFNVMQFDFPGQGQSGGPRAGCTTQEFTQAWKDGFDYASQRFGEPFYALAVAEDSTTCYYAAANRADVRALSIHTLFEYGDPEGTAWEGPPWLVRVKAAALGTLAKLAPGLVFPGTRSIPYRKVFGGPSAAWAIGLLSHDPLAWRNVSVKLAYSFIQHQPLPVPFEHCRTPVQVIVSERSQLWPAAMVERNYERLGGPKDLVHLLGAPHWQFSREYHEAYCAHAIRWFGANSGR